jgi:N-acetylglucosaminyldiphosphoundecaprenol N-acetyl-beta-D-mannosaminyltransferase
MRPSTVRLVDPTTDVAVADRMPPLQTRFVLGMRVDATTYDDAAWRIVGWAKGGESRYVCVATVNNVMEAHDDGRYLRVMNEADLVTPDGMPLVWGLRRMGIPQATRVYGPDLTPVVLDMAEAEGVPVGFYGGSPRVLDALLATVAGRWPDLRVAHASSPPFRDLSAEEDEEITLSIVASGVRILFVGLGCPKQEQWMADHRDRLPAVMVGVGAAFDFLAGTKRQAPRLLQRAGLEWAFRLAMEPRRLWRRYLRHNPRFALLFGRQLVGASLGRRRA